MWDDLVGIDHRFAYHGERTRYIAFPLGGIGAGGFSISGSGRLIDWSIRNRPALQGYNGYSHFAIKAEKDGQLVDARVLNGPYDLNPSGAPGLRKMFDGFGHGANRQTLAGVPHFREVDFYGRFPTADLVFRDRRFPGGLRLTAFSPFIPHDARDSGMPVAMFEFEIDNNTDAALTYTLAGTLGNYGANSGEHTFTQGRHRQPLPHLLGQGPRGNRPRRSHHRHRRGGGGARRPPLPRPVVRQPRRLLEGVRPPRPAAAAPLRHPRASRHMSLQPEHATLAARITVPAGEMRKLRFAISWSFPRGDIYWAFRSSPDAPIPDKPTPSWRNWYATEWPHSAASAREALTRWDDLKARTLAFRDGLFGSTLPPEVIDAASATLALLRTATVIRLEGGEIWAWEGQHTQDGSCEGSCTHVWNYQQALSHLFPALERTLRETEFAYNMLPTGGLTFRQKLPLGSGLDAIGPCADGHFGAIVKTCRDWKLSGDTDWLSAPLAAGEARHRIRLEPGEPRPLGPGRDRHPLRPPAPDPRHGALRAQLLARLHVRGRPPRRVRDGRRHGRHRPRREMRPPRPRRRRLYRRRALQRPLVRAEDRPRRQVRARPLRHRPQGRRAGRRLHGDLLVRRVRRAQVPDGRGLHLRPDPRPMARRGRRPRRLPRRRTRSAPRSRPSTPTTSAPTSPTTSTPAATTPSSTRAACSSPPTPRASASPWSPPPTPRRSGPASSTCPPRT